MQTLESLSRKIKTAEDLLGVVKTMKSLAAVNIRQFERAVESLEQYRRVVDMGWHVFLKQGGPVSRSARSTLAVCLVIGSDQGLCGQFNEVLMNRVAHEIDGLKKEVSDVSVWSMGEKVRDALSDMGYGDGERFSAPEGLTAVNTRVMNVLQMIESWRSARGLAHFYLCHNMLSGQSGYTQTFYRVLPLDVTWANKILREKWPTRCLPMMGLSMESMFAHLFHQHLFVSFYRALAQSLASENAARLMAMQAAEKNIMETQDQLQGQFREQRQASITNELFDIISGFEALSDDTITV